MVGQFCHGKAAIINSLYGQFCFVLEFSLIFKMRGEEWIDYVSGQKPGLDTLMWGT